MIHFVLPGGVIPASHLRPLIRHFDEQGIEYDCTDHIPRLEQVRVGHLYITCDMTVDKVLWPARSDLIQVQLAHNLTGLKGSSFANSLANLNILPGRQVAEVQCADMDDPRFVIGGYGKWDLIYPERYRIRERREEITKQGNLNPLVPWILFYPTGGNQMCKGSSADAPAIYDRIEQELDGFEFLFCCHDHNRHDPETQMIFGQLNRTAEAKENVHIVDGSDSLRYIAACDLFVTDIASSLITAISMNKPIAFTELEHTSGRPDLIRQFQCGAFWQDIADYRAYIADHRPAPELGRLLEKCVAFNDDHNCFRITDTI